MKKYIIYLYLTLMLAMIPLTMNYDIYSYHYWAYNAIKNGTSDMYNSDEYFDRTADYPPAGVMIEILQGKLLSMFAPLRIGKINNFAPYKVFPFIAFAILILILAKYSVISQLRLVLFSLPLGLATVLTGNTESIVILFLFLSIVFIRRGEIIPVIAVLVISCFIKQTAVFPALALGLIAWSRKGFNARIPAYAVIITIITTVIALMPFMFSGNLLPAMKAFTGLTMLSAPVSGNAFNILSLIKSADIIRYNHNILNISFRTYSIVLLLASLLFVIMLRKRPITDTFAVFMILWFNFTVGLRDNHILYPMFFMLMSRERKQFLPALAFSVIAFINLFAFKSIVMMHLFGIPHIPYILKALFSAVQVAAGGLFIRNYFRSSYFEPPAADHYNFGKGIIIIIVFALFVYSASFIPGRTEGKNDELLSTSILERRMLDYSDDRYIDLNIISTGVFNNHLGVRMSDSAFFLIEPGEITCFEFSGMAEFGDSAAVIINSDTFLLRRIPAEFRFDCSNDSILQFNARTFSTKGNAALYNLRITGGR